LAYRANESEKLANRSGMEADRTPICGAGLPCSTTKRRLCLDSCRYSRMRKDWSMDECGETANPSADRFVPTM